MSDINQLLTPFQPINGPDTSTVAVTAGTSAPTGTLLPTAADGHVAAQFECKNSGSAAVALGFGSTAAAAAAAAVVPTGSAGGYTLLPGERRVITITNAPPNQPLYASGISASASQVVYITPGAGT